MYEHIARALFDSFGVDDSSRRDGITYLTVALNKLFRQANMCIGDGLPTSGSVFGVAEEAIECDSRLTYMPFPDDYREMDSQLRETWGRNIATPEEFDALFTQFSDPRLDDTQALLNLTTFIDGHLVAWLPVENPFETQIIAWNNRVTATVIALILVAMLRDQVLSRDGVVNPDSYFPAVQFLDDEAVNPITQGEIAYQEAFEKSFFKGFGGKLGTEYARAFTQMISWMKFLLKNETLDEDYEERRNTHLAEVNEYISSWKAKYTGVLSGVSLSEEDAKILIPELTAAITPQGNPILGRTLGEIVDGVPQDVENAVVAVGTLGGAMSSAVLSKWIMQSAVVGGVAPVGILAVGTLAVGGMAASGTLLMKWGLNQMRDLNTAMRLTIAYYLCKTGAKRGEVCEEVMREIRSDRCGGTAGIWNRVTCHTLLIAKIAVGSFVTYKLLGIAHERLNR